MNIIDLFTKEELTETSSGYKTICPHCGLQGGRTEGFIIFSESDTAYCHSSGKWFNLFQVVCLKLGLIQCIEGNEKGESPNIEKEDYIEQIKEAKGEEFLNDLQSSIEDIFDFLIAEVIGNKITYKVDIDKVSDHIIKNFDIKTITGIKNDDIYTYKDGVWMLKGRGLIKAEAEQLLGRYAKNNIVYEILEKIKRKTTTSIEEFEKVPEYKRCVMNGVLDIEDVNNIKWLEHSKEYNFKIKLPIYYDDEAKCPNIDKFFEETFYPEDIPQVLEWFGHHIPNKYIFKKAVIAHGPKHTGKTVFINLLSSFVGDGNKTGLSLQKISVGKSFDLHSLKNKVANIHDDLSSKDLSEAGGFKMAVGDGYITGEKKFGDYHTFKNSAKHTFTCNIIPPINDIDDEAYYDRWLLWELDNVIDKKDKNINLINELTTKEELSGLFNKAIMYWVSLIKRNYFYKEKECEEIKSLMVKSGNSYSKFATDMLVEEIGSKVTKEEMHNQYCHYCNSQEPKISPQTKTNLGKQLPRYAPYLISSKSNSERYWLNVNISYTKRGTEGTVIEKAIERLEKVDNDANMKHIKLPKLSLLSLDKTITKRRKKMSRKRVTKKRTEREIQYWEIPEFKNIKPECTKQEVYDWINKHPDYNHKELRDKFGIGSYKFEKELKEEEKIK